MFSVPYSFPFCEKVKKLYLSYYAKKMTGGIKISGELTDHGIMCA